MCLLSMLFLVKAYLKGKTHNNHLVAEATK